MSTQHDPSGPLRVLVADDSRDAADAAALLIGLWGHDCRVAYGGGEAVELAEKFRPDVVFADLAMPRVDGLELARRLRQLYHHRPILVAVTGFADAAHRRMAEEAGFDLYIPKPPDPDQLQRMLDESHRILRVCHRTTRLAEYTEQLQDQSRSVIRELRQALLSPRPATVQP